MSHPQLDDLSRQLDEATARAERLVAGVDVRRFSARPAPNAWSAAECLAHLNITTGAYLPVFDKALATPAATASDQEIFRKGLIGWVLAWSIEPPYRLKTKTAARFVPGPVHFVETVATEFVSGQRQLKRRLAAFEGRDLNRLKIRSPFNEKIAYNVYAAFVILLAHERRHLWQAEQTLLRLAGARG
jgi:hypothetical protein